MASPDISRVRKKKPAKSYDLKSWAALVPADPDKRYSKPDFKPEWHLCGDETLDSIAASTPCRTWQELVRYNWGLSHSDPHLEENVNWYLFEYCSCRMATDSEKDPGYNYVFVPASPPQRIILPVRVPPPPPSSCVGSRGCGPTTLDPDCKYLDPASGSGAHNMCKMPTSKITCFKRPQDVSAKEPSISLPASESKVVNRNFQEAKAATLTLSERRISDYVARRCRLRDLGAGAYVWLSQTLQVEFLQEVLAEEDVRKASGGAPIRVHSPAEADDHLNLADPLELHQVAGVLTELELAGRLARIIVRGYPDYDEAGKKGLEQLPLRRAEYIISRLETGYGLLQPPVEATAFGCTGFYCQRPTPDPDDRVAVVEVFTNSGAPSSSARIISADTSSPIYTYTYNWYKGPDLGPDFTGSPVGTVVRTSLTRQAESGTQVATNPAELQAIRHEALSYFDHFVQVMYPGSAFVAGDSALRAKGSAVSRIYDWIQSWRLVGKGPNAFPALGDAYKFKDLITGKWRTPDLSFTVKDATYTVEETSTSAAHASALRQSALRTTTPARDSRLVPLSGLRVRFKQGMPLPSTMAH